jgi:bifunctional DNase/RNase
MRNFMIAFNVELHEVIINDLNEGIFYSRLLCSNDNDTVEIDSRTSDALALAVRFGCPIYTYENILDSAGHMLDNSGQKKSKSKETEQGTPVPERRMEDLRSMSLDELNTLLDEVLEQEDYMRAIAIRDEIKSRSGK